MTVPKFAARHVGKVEPGSEQWLGLMTGSKVAAVLGLSPYESRFSLWHRMNGSVGAQEHNAAMDRGNELEAAIVSRFARTHPDLRVQRTGLWTSRSLPWAAVSPDALAQDRDSGRWSLIEAKTAAVEDEWGADGSADIPVYYRAQVMWAMHILGLRTCHLPALLGRLQFRTYTIAYDLVEALAIEDQCREFMTSIDAGQRPSIDAHAQTYAVIKELHPDIDGTEFELSTDLAHQFITAKTSLKAAKEHADLVTNLVADAMGTAHKATYAGLTLARRQAKNGGTPYLVSATKLPQLGAAA